MKSFSSKITEYLLVTLIIYSVLTIIRSLGVLVLVYTDNYFYNFDFDINNVKDKVPIYIRTYFFMPYIVGFVLSVFIKWILNLKWTSYIICLVLSLGFFIVFDVSFVRKWVYIFDNPRTNFVFHLVLFLLLSITSILYYRKRGYNG